MPSGTFRHIVDGWAKPLLGLTIFVLLGQQHCIAQGDVSLSSLQWQHRIVLVKAATGKSAKLLKQALQDHSAAVMDRDILWYIVSDKILFHNHSDYGYGKITPAFSAALVERLSAYSVGHVILLGKDGGVKSDSNSLNLQALFNTVDAMPMRKQEMRRKKANDKA